MPIQVAAHGFDLTPSLKDCCTLETQERLSPLAQHGMSAKWVLSVEKGEHIAHINWNDGSYHGDATVKTEDMYSSIKQAVKKAAEQLKRAHEKKYNH